MAEDMFRNLHKAAVITGCVNAFCLVCDIFFKDKAEAHNHIKHCGHYDNLCLFPHLEKYKNQNIRKVKYGYYCEFCNKLLLTTIRVDLHIAEENHKHERARMLLRSSKNGVIAFENVHIQERAWHSIMDNVCFLCDVDVGNETEHKSDIRHVLNLIQEPVKIGDNGAIYRQMDDTTVQCLTCNVIVKLNTLNKHFSGDDHRDRYDKCKIEQNNMYIDLNEEGTKDTKQRNYGKAVATAIDISDTNDDKPKISKEIDIPNIISSVETFRAHNIDIDFETDKAFCRKCCVDIEFEYNDIIEHIEAHPKTTRQAQSMAQYPADFDKSIYCQKPKAHEMREAACSDNNHENNTSKVNPIESSGVDENINDATLFANENQLIYNEKKRFVFCQICQVKLPSTLKSMKEHVRGASHIKKNNASIKSQSRTQIKTLTKLTMKQFVNSVETLLNLYPKYCLVNGRFCMHELSFFLITQNTRGLRCLLCEKNIYCNTSLYTFEVQAHVDENTHHSKMQEVPVIMSETSEFIREIRPDTFHCGFCNLVVSSWSEMERHIKCTDHIQEKKELAARVRREYSLRLQLCRF